MKVKTSRAVMSRACETAGRGESAAHAAVSDLVYGWRPVEDTVTDLDAAIALLTEARDLLRPVSLFDTEASA